MPDPIPRLPVSYVAFTQEFRYIRYTMPKVDPDAALLTALDTVVRAAGGNESEAARRLGITRLKINRVRKARGGATPATRTELWKKLERLEQSNQGGTSNDTYDTYAIQIVRDVPGIALQVLRYMAAVVERDIKSEGQPHAQ